jgi:hypothetical protein
MSKVDANVCYRYMEVGRLTMRPEVFSFVWELPLLAIYVLSIPPPLDLAKV